MLLSIKEFAEGFEALRITDMEEARRLLFTQDVLSPYNVVRDHVIELVNDTNKKRKT